MTAFVIEGIDRVGKSTFIEKAIERFGLQKVWVERPAENGWETEKLWEQGKNDLTNWVWTFREENQKHFIMDRFSYSEVIYAELFNRPCDFDWYKKNLRDAQDVLKLIIMRTDRDVVRGRWAIEGMPIENVDKICDKYDRLPHHLRLSPDNFVFIDPMSQVELAMGWIKERL